MKIIYEPKGKALEYAPLACQSLQGVSAWMPLLLRANPTESGQEGDDDGGMAAGVA